MRRRAVFLLSTLLLVATALGVAHVATAQNTGQATHPAVGAWIVHRDPMLTPAAAEQLVLSADGIAIDVGLYQATSVGVWQATGASTATVTLTVQVPDGPGKIVVRANITVAPDGKSFSGSFTSETIIDPAQHLTSGEIGPGKVMGERMPVQAPGTPAMSFQEYLPHTSATPAATPSS